jgi:lipopolysaccharide export system protein LptA
MEGKNEYMEGSAQRIEYNGRMDKVQLYTKAWVKRGEDIVHGDYIMYDANAEYAEVIGGGPQGTSGGRVRAIIQPKGKQPAVPLNPAPAKSSQTPAKTSSMTINPADDAETALPVKNMRLSRNLAVSPQ